MKLYGHGITSVFVGGKEYSAADGVFDVPDDVGAELLHHGLTGAPAAARGPAASDMLAAVAEIEKLRGLVEKLRDDLTAAEQLAAEVAAERDQLAAQLAKAKKRNP